MIKKDYHLKFHFQDLASIQLNKDDNIYKSEALKLKIKTCRVSELNEQNINA